MTKKAFDCGGDSDLLIMGLADNGVKPELIAQLIGAHVDYVDGVILIHKEYRRLDEND